MCPRCYLCKRGKLCIGRRLRWNLRGTVLWQLPGSRHPFCRRGKGSPGCLKIQHRQGDGGDHQKSDKSRHNADQERFPVRAAAVGRGFSGHTETPPFCKWLAPVLPSPVRLAQWTGGEAVSFHGSTIRAQTQGCVFPRGRQRARLKKAARAVETFWPPDASPSIGRRRCA